MRRFCVAALVLVVGLCRAASARAGALSPCITATLSANGNALVVNELTLSGRDGDIGRKVEASAFRVFRSYRDLNAGLRVNGPDKYWAEPMWELNFTWGKSPSVGCPYVLVTDDAEYLVLMGRGSDRVALSIYRRDQRARSTGSVGAAAGVLVREVALSDLSPEVPAREMWTDHTPEWYSSGTFSFSADERTLIFTTNDGKRLQISLLTGDVKR